MPTLADRTIYGMAPGDGPLRPGGVTPKDGAPTSDEDLPSKKSAAAERQEPALTRARDLWDGAESLRAQATAYLPKAPGEKPQNYNSRLARTAFFNAFRRTVDGLTGLVFRKDPALSEDVPVQIRGTEGKGGHWENIDNAGTHGDVFCRDLLQEALIAGHTAILVEFPRTDGGQDSGAELSGEIRPYWIPVSKENILSWRTTVENGRTILSQLVLCEKTTAPKGMFGEQQVEAYRVFHRDVTGVWWQLLQVSDDKKVVVVDEGTYPTQEEIPVAEIVSSGRRGIFDSDPPLNDLGYLNIAHYQMWSDYNWSIHKTCVPFIFGRGITEATDANGQKVPLDVGANSAVLQPNSEADMKYVSHSGESLGEVKAALDDLKNDMGTLGLAMLSPQKRTAETAEAKRLDKATSDSALAVTARGLQDGLERALGFHARYLGEESGGSITINRDFEGLLMDAPVMQAYAQLVNAGFPPRAVLQALQQGGRIMPDEDLDVLEMEWLAGKAAREAEREAQLEDMQQVGDDTD